jgi:hypothetical protein
LPIDTVITVKTHGVLVTDLLVNALLQQNPSQMSSDCDPDTIWSCVDDFTNAFYQDEHKKAIAIAEKIFDNILSQSDTRPAWSLASQIEFVIYSVGTMIMREKRYLELDITKLYLNAIEFLTKRPDFEAYYIKNNMQGILEVLCAIMLESKDNKKIVHQFCRIMARLTKTKLILPNASKNYYKCLKITVKLVAKEPNELYYDASYKRKSDLRTAVLELLRDYHQSDDYKNYFRMKLDSLAELEVHIASIFPHKIQNSIYNYLTIYGENWKSKVNCSALRSMRLVE